MSDYDSPWKEALALYFMSFMAFFFPDAYNDIDWSRGYEVLDKELQQIVREAEHGRRYADILVKVWLKNGEEEWVLVHVEVQSQEEADFAQRMYVYNFRLFDRYNRRIVSLAILGDERPDWRPAQFGYDLWNCRIGFWFPVVKLLDYGDRQAELEGDDNPFAILVLAHLKTQATRGDPQERRGWKFRLIKGLYERGLDQVKIRQFFRLIDWMMDLPKEVARQFWDEFQHYEKEKHMPYVSTGERIGMEKGMEKGRTLGLAEGLLQGIELGLELKFGQEGLQLLSEIQKIDDVEVLRAFHKKIKTATTVDDLRKSAFLS